MVSQSSSPGARNAGLYLRFLLQRAYRSRWDRPEYRERNRDDEIHHLAVAQVLAGQLQRAPRPGRPEDREVLASQLAALVSRALRGQKLSAQTLELFITAFAIRDGDAEELRRQWRGQAPQRVVVGDLPPLVGVQSAVRPYQTTLLHEFHQLGADGRPVRHRTVQSIQALVDGISVHRYSFDTTQVSVERIHGGVPGEPYQLKEAVWAVDLALPRVLNRFDETSLEYVTTFHYTGPVEPTFRRAVHQFIENVAFQVVFHPDRLPRAVWWAEWKDYREPNDHIIYQEEVELDREHSVYRRLDLFERAVAGFVWEFDGGRCTAMIA